MHGRYIIIIIYVFISFECIANTLFIIIITIITLQLFFNVLSKHSKYNRITLLIRL